MLDENLFNVFILPINNDILPITAKPNEAPNLIIKKYIPILLKYLNEPLCSFEKKKYINPVNVPTNIINELIILIQVTSSPVNFIAAV